MIAVYPPQASIYTDGTDGLVFWYTSRCIFSSNIINIYRWLLALDTSSLWDSQDSLKTLLDSRDKSISFMLACRV